MASATAGRAPALKALQLFNSTVYRWNRACYGIKDGIAHLRIENRVLPAGPSVLDEGSNAAFWFGLTDDQLVEAYPWEDWILARSLVGPIPADDGERDLFAGVRERVAP